MNRVERRNGIVTGAASGIGRAIAVRLARDGWHLALADIDTAGAEETVRLVEQAGGTAQVEPLDVRDEEAWMDLRARLRGEWRHLDLIVNNAGVVASGEIGAMSIDDWDWLLSINLRGVILGCHTMMPWLVENPRRSYVLNMASIAGLISGPKMGAYNVSKAGVVSLSETLFQEVRPHNVGVTAVCPWFVKTNLLDHGRFTDMREKAAGAMFMEQSPVTPEKVADQAVRGMYRGRLLVVVGFRANQLFWVKRQLPYWYFRIAELVQRRILAPFWPRESSAPHPPKKREPVAVAPDLGSDCPPHHA
jgi:NAD(P)-dependent dehydrogenase (short-subunit alcohol dehydrogenase family)